MKVRNKVSWAGHHFSHQPGDIIELPDHIAKSRIEDGLATAAPAGAAITSLHAEPDTGVLVAKPEPKGGKKAAGGKAAGGQGTLGVDTVTGAKAPDQVKNPDIDDAPLDENGLRTDGPTLDEFVKAGYPADRYPPQGYAAKPSSVDDPSAPQTKTADDGA